MKSTRKSRAARENSASIEISIPGASTPPTYSPVGRDDVEVRRRAEVDDDARRAVALLRGHGVRDPVGPDLARVVVADRDPGADARAHDEQPARRPSAGELLVLADERRHRRRQADAVDRVEVEQTVDQDVRARPPCGAARSRRGSARRAGRRRTRRRPSACCPRRLRGASVRSRGDVPGPGAGTQSDSDAGSAQCGHAGRDSRTPQRATARGHRGRKASP